MSAAQTGGAVMAVNGARWRLLLPHLRLGPDHRVLDVGCGYGSFLAYVHARSRCQIHGVDTDAGSLEGSLCAHQADLRVGDLQQVGFPSGHFKLVALLQSLEHMRDPLATLREVHRLLEPGGLLLVEVPNYGALLRRVFGRWWLPLLLPQHLVHFEAASLRAMLRKAGLGEVLLLRPAWCAVELTGSVGGLLSHLLGLLPTPGRPSPEPGWRGRVLAVLLPLVFLLVELPLGLLLRLTGQSGSLVAIVRAQAPAPPDPAGASHDPG